MRRVREAWKGDTGGSAKQVRAQCGTGCAPADGGDRNASLYGCFADGGADEAVAAAAHGGSGRRKVVVARARTRRAPRCGLGSRPSRGWARRPRPRWRACGARARRALPAPRRRAQRRAPRSVRPAARRRRRRSARAQPRAGARQPRTQRVLAARAWREEEACSAGASRASAGAPPDTSPLYGVTWHDVYAHTTRMHIVTSRARASHAQRQRRPLRAHSQARRRPAAPRRRCRGAP